LTARSFVSIFCASLAVATVLRLVAHPKKQILDIPRVQRAARPLDIPKTPRRIYPFSVIPGGAYSSEELALARRVDRVVAAHYSDFDAARISVRSLPEDTFLYVSYRRADRIYWTANKRRIPKGESILCDGEHMARTRCGNRLSASPQFPIAAGPQPTEAALNAPEFPSGLDMPQAPLFSPRYDTPVMPLVEARERFLSFPTGVSGASALGEAFPDGDRSSPIMVIADLPSGLPGAPASTGPGGSSPSGGAAPGGGSPAPGGSGPIPGSTVPEPSNAALIAAGALSLLAGYQPVRRRRSIRR